MSAVWNKLIVAERLGEAEPSVVSEAVFQEDYNTLVFSAPLRRLQNKTQVFPLPGSIFVHNRLTHSLEVAAVGRRLAKLAMTQLATSDGSVQNELIGPAAVITQTACLAHDLGNPPFGHAGERAIAAFFAEGEGSQIEPLVMQELGTERGTIYWSDLCSFDGNAAGFRLLIRQYQAARWGGRPLSLPVLASIVKYPHSSTLAQARHKFGFFLSDTPQFVSLAERLGLKCAHEQGEAVAYARHPLSYFVEAADDICYQIMDLEDACKLGIIPTEKRSQLLRGITRSTEESSLKAIDCLTRETARVFCLNVERILEGELAGSLLDYMQPTLLDAYKECAAVAREQIYKAQAVVDVELAGYHIISMLLSLLTRAAIEPHKESHKILLSRVPEQYGIQTPSLTERVMAIVDYIAGMTDVYALDLYRKITGHSLPSI